MVVAKACGLAAVTLALASLLGCPFFTMRQRLREWYQEATAKAGTRRRQLEVATCFAPLLRGIVQAGPGPQLAVARDATSLGNRFVTLAISVVYRGSAMPVAWTILPAAQKKAGRDPWLALLAQFHALVPTGWTVIVLADQGLWAKWLVDGIKALGWHPVLRINQGGTFRPAGWTHFVPLARLTPQVGMRWRGRGTAFSTKAAQLDGTLLAWWGAGHAEPWLVLTDWPPACSDACWYGLRAWIEQGFKDQKRGGWQWQRTRMTDPARAERLWLAIAVATVWLLRVGGAAEAAIAAGTVPELRLRDQQPTPRPRRWRLVSVFQRGWTTILTAVLGHRRLPLGRFVPEPWPESPDLPEAAQGALEINHVA